MHDHDTPVSRPYTTDAWQLFALLCQTTRPHDRFAPHIAAFLAAHIGELARVATSQDCAAHYAELNHMHHCFRLEPTGKTLLRNRIYRDEASS